MSTYGNTSRTSFGRGYERDQGREFERERDVVTPPRVRQVVDAPPPTPAVTEPELVAEHQKHMPEGQGAMVEERNMTPWVMAILATSVLVAGALVIGLSFGWVAAIVGIVWLLMGYAVSWSVVWGAGLFRARDEEIVEEKVDQGELPPPPGRVG